MLSRTNFTPILPTSGRVRIALATLAAMSVTLVILLGVTTTQAQSGNGAVPNLRLSSASPGDLTIAWGRARPGSVRLPRHLGKAGLGLSVLQELQQGQPRQRIPQRI